MSGTPLFNPNDGLTGRNGGPYLDEVQAQQDEIRRAAVEGREPDLNNPSANAGIQLSTAAQMLATLSVQNNPSMEHIATAVVAESVAKREGDVLTAPITDERPDTDDATSVEDLDTVTYNSTDPAAPPRSVEGDDDNPAVEVVTPDFDPTVGESDGGTGESTKADGAVTGDSTNVPE